MLVVRTPLSKTRTTTSTKVPPITATKGSRSGKADSIPSYKDPLSSFDYTQNQRHNNQLLTTVKTISYIPTSHFLPTAGPSEFTKKDKFNGSACQNYTNRLKKVATVLWISCP